MHVCGTLREGVFLRISVLRGLPSNTAKHPRRSPEKVSSASSSISGAGFAFLCLDVNCCTLGSAKYLSSPLRLAICHTQKLEVKKKKNNVKGERGGAEGGWKKNKGTWVVVDLK